MGLQLYSPPGSDFPTDLSDPLEYRYLPGRAGAEGLNPHAKHHRRPLSWTQWKLSCAQFDGEEALVGLAEDSPRHKQHIVNLAKTNVRYHRQYNAYHCSFPCDCREFQGVKHVTKGYRKACMNDAVEEGRALALSDIVLPGDHSRGIPLETARGRSRSTPRSRSSSPPSLGRQDAFRDSRTTKKRSYRTMSTAASAALAKVVVEGEVTKQVTSPAKDDVEDLCRLGLLRHNDDDEVEQLYKMGLLYDDKHERGSGFTFHAVDHNEPVYKLDVRPTKRGRKNRVGSRSTNAVTSAAPRNTQEESIQLELALNLSLAAFGEDEELAAFLISPSESEILTLDDDVEVSGSTESVSKRRCTESQERIERPLTVIYELEDDDFSQEDARESQEISHGFNNHGGNGEVEDETWAFVDDSNDFNEDFNYKECNAAAATASLDNTRQDQDQDAWIHVLHPSRQATKQ